MSETTAKPRSMYILMMAKIKQENYTRLGVVGVSVGGACVSPLQTLCLCQPFL